MCKSHETGKVKLTDMTLALGMNGCYSPNKLEYFHDVNIDLFECIHGFAASQVLYNGLFAVDANFPKFYKCAYHS